MNWTEDQKNIIHAKICNLLVSAAAGSGKTAVLVERIIQMISDKEHPINVDELLVVTFTKAAAAQMKEKIAAAIEKMLEKEPENSHYLNQINYINKANILTIDSFCYQVVKEHFHVLGIDPNIRVGEAGEIGLLREEILGKVIEQFYENNKDFVDFSDSFSADKNDEKVEEYILKIYKVCSSYPQPSEWIRQAKASLEISSEEEFIELDYVKKYFDEIHATAAGIKDVILECLEKARSIDGPLYMEKALLGDIQIIDDVISARTYSQFYDFADAKFPNIGRGKKGEYNEDIAEEIKEYRKKYKKQYEALFACFNLPFDVLLEQADKQKPMLTALLDTTEEFRNQFLQAKLDKSILEFSDVEHFALQVLCKGYDENGTPIPSEIGKEMAEGFKEILIDEYQDSNYLQEAILQSVSTIYQGKNNIFMVGDVKQSIYGFRMARPNLFMDKYHTYGSAEDAPCRKLLLKNNFRSRANVLESINYIFYQIMGSDLGGIDYTEDEALVPGRTFPEIEDDSVELLLGESKDFDFLSLKDEEMSGEKEEDLDENLEDIGKVELEATMVAHRIEKLMGADGSKPFQVTEGENQLRNAEYKDMVILFRGVKGVQQIFQEILTAHNIPVKVQNENGYFDTVEIKQILSLLKVVDNPHNDVEMAAVLRGYFGGFTSEDLALLTLVKKDILKDSKEKMFVYSVVKYLSDLGETAFSEELSQYEAYIRDILSVKCKKTLDLLNELQEIKAIQTIGGLLTEIYYKTGYYYYVSAMPDGIQRANNLELLLAETRKFENGSFQSVFDFLQFVDRLQEKAIELGGEATAESNENAVRIMTIHKSKGLEFPIVFLSGMGKGFNKMDTKQPLIIHSDYYLGAKYRNPKKRSGNDTFTRKAFTALMITENLAEELRILYVGLTRAKEKLIMTGVTQDIPKLIKKYEKAARKEETKLSYGIVHTADNYLDFVTAALMRNAEFHNAMEKVRKRMNGKDEKSIVSAEYEMPFVIKEPDIRLKVEIKDFKSLVVSHIQSNADKQQDKRERLTLLEHAPKSKVAKIEENLSWEYEKQQLTLQKSKMSVTEIKRIYETDYETSDVIKRNGPMTKEYKPPVPRFIEGAKKMDAAARGTWLHKTMELLDNAGISTREQVNEALSLLWQEERLPEETKEFVTPELIYNFVTSSLGKRMCEAAKRGELYKEKQFVIGVSTEKITGVKTEADTIPVVVQGIIDAYFKEGDNLILLDYKSDHIKAGEEDILIDHYKTQLQYYKDTLEQLTGLTVSETYIYSFAVNKEIRVF